MSLFRLLVSVSFSFGTASRWQCGLRHRSVAVRLLGLQFPIPPGAWMSVFCECWILSLRRADSSSRRVIPCVCVIKCDINPLYLKLVGKNQTKKESRDEIG